MCVVCGATKNGDDRALIVPCSVPVCAALPHGLLLQPRASHHLTPHAASSPTVVVLRRAFAPLRARTTRRPCRPPLTLPNTVSYPVSSPVPAPVSALPLLHVRLKLPQKFVQKRREATSRDPTRPAAPPPLLRMLATVFFGCNGLLRMLAALPPALLVPRIAPPLRCLLFKGKHDRLGKRRGQARAPKRPPHPLQRLGQTHSFVAVRVERRVQSLGERRRRPSRRVHLFDQRAQCLERATEGTGGTEG